MNEPECQSKDEKRNSQSSNWIEDSRRCSSSQTNDSPKTDMKIDDQHVTHRAEDTRSYHGISESSFHLCPQDQTHRIRRNHRLRTSNLFQRSRIERIKFQKVNLHRVWQTVLRRQHRSQRFWYWVALIMKWLCEEGVLEYQPLGTV